MKQTYILATTIAIGGLAAALTGCNQHASEQQQRPPTPEVTVAPVQQQEVVEWDEFTGRTEPVESVELRPRVSGYIQEVRFKSGQLVKKGDVLFVIDPRWHQAEYDKLAADAERAKVQFENAKREADRSAQLLANKAISTEESDARVMRFNAAKAALLSAEAARDFGKLDLDHTQVRAPINGRVSRALLTEGNYVSGIAGAATTLTTIVSVDPVYVYVDVDEDTLLKYNSLAAANKLQVTDDGKVPVELQLGDEDGFTHKGSIESFDNKLDPNTGSILLRAVFSNADARIVPGLFARIRVPLSDKHQAMLVSERAIGTDQAQKYVLSLTQSNTVAYSAVKLGPVINGKRVIRSGLQPGDKIVVNGLQRVRPGMPVVPKDEVAESNGEKPAGENKVAKRN
ncbi:MAG: efflux transporter, family, subunit [Verrucomicrobiales bacterium]|nr:efflux transporter, family, subunit [Verrucomicrobiales bacterium]